MTKVVSVAEAKKRFSELMGQVLYQKERFIIERKGKPTVALVSIEDLKRLKIKEGKKKGLLAAVGAWGEFEGIDDFIKELYEARKKAYDRKVSVSL
ncbi:MAG: type II toxin-antitoxin system Phd/YefM family antitoxin [Nitrospirae bacterium]|nr:type II toxin-antitoxin system Phd/YefM family antitoxin [Nitrospirota bacterium]